MSEHEKKTVENCLFSRQGMTLTNIRFFRGTDDVISEEEFKRELCSASERKSRGEVTQTNVAPRCKKPSVDLNEFVASL
jgi:hypothetical protein